MTDWEHFPLSYPQLQVQVMLLASPTRTLDNANSWKVLEVVGDELAPDRIREALASIVRRHAPLRTVPRFDLNPALQHVYSQRVADAVEVTVSDVRDLPPPSTGRLIAAEAARPFALDGSPLVRAAWYRTGTASGLLQLTSHHFAADLLSVGLLHREFCAAYA